MKNVYLILIMLLSCNIFAGMDVGTGASGGVSTSVPLDFLIEVVKGNVPGHSSINKFGHNPAATTGEDVWGGGGTYAFYPTSAQTVQAVSTSTNDTDGGTGARTAIFYGLDSNWEEANETVTLNGTTPVVLSTQFIRMFRGIVLTAGSVGTNDGNLSVAVSGGDTAIYINAGDGQTQHAIYTVPAGKSAYFLKGYVGVSDGGNSASRESAILQWKARLNNGITGAWAVKGQIECINDGSTHFIYEYGIPAGPLPEKTDIRIQCETASTTLGIVGGFDLLLVEDGY